MSEPSKHLQDSDRATDWSIILNKPIDDTIAFSINTIFRELKSIYKFVAMIEHDQEEKGDGALKTYHVHIYLKTHRTRKATLIKDLEDLLNLPKEVISVRAVINERKMMRYLIHIDEDAELKPHYAPFQVITTDEDYYNSFLIDREEMINEEKIIRIVNEEGTPSKILLKIGKENYLKWSRIISDLLRMR